MKITKQRISQIIKEELEKVLQEEPIEHRYNAEEDNSEDPHKTTFTEFTEEQLESLYNQEEDQLEQDHRTSMLPLGQVKEPEEKIEEVTPPGKEKMVKDLKKELPKTYTDKETGKRKESNPWAVAWAEKNKEEKK